MMTKLAGILALGAGAFVLSGSTPAEAQQMHRNSRGVDMRCDAGRQACSFHNIRDRDRFCTWSVNYVVRGRGGPQALSQSGNLVINSGGRRSVTFHTGRGHVHRIQNAALECRHRKHWGPPPPPAQPPVVRNSRGVDMRCSAGTRVCTFHNIRDRDRFCTWSVSYLVPGRGALNHAGNVVVGPRGQRSATFHMGPDEVRRIQDATLLCRHRKHWGPPPPPAQPPVVRNSRGVDMRCSADTRVCTFHNIRDRDRFCTWSVSYLVPGRGALNRAGNVVVGPRGQRSATFHMGRHEVRRIQDATLLCRHRRHW